METANFSLQQFSLEGKVAIVTGGNTGLGQAFSVALAKAGASIYIPSITQDAEEFTQAMEQIGATYQSHQFDITEDGAAESIIGSCIREFGQLDILINSAGISLLADVQDFTRVQWDKMLSINLTAAFELSHHAAKHMITRQQGKIINVCSLFSFLGGLQSPAYAASKHGIAGLTKAYCDELAQYNVQVNGIAPGYIETPLTEHVRQNEEANQKIIDHIPAQRWGKPADLMGTIVFLASAASNYVNGHILSVDGGYLVR